MRWIALLRGINLAGKNKLSMKDLAAMFEEAGAEDVKTYIQSGNVVFSASAAVAKALPQRIEKEIAKRLDLRVPVIVRSASDLAKVIDANPFKDPATVHVMFLADKPAASKVKALDPDRSPPDEIRPHGREIYMNCPKGIGGTKFSNQYFESKLDTQCTSRNWRTVQKLLELAE